MNDGDISPSSVQHVERACAFHTKVLRHGDSAGIFLLSLTTLLVEVLLTRVFDVLLTPHLAFMVITCAMFGLALGGFFDAVAATPTRDVYRPALGFAAAVAAMPLLLNLIPFSVDELGREPLRQAGAFLLLYCVLLAPFFFAGLCVCRVFAAHATDIRRLYGWDLTGAAVGAALLIPLLPRLGPERLLLASGICGLIVSALFAGRGRWVQCAALAVAAVLGAHALGGRYFTLELHDNRRDARREIAAGQLEFLRWDPVSTIAVLNEPPATRSVYDNGRKHVAYDGGTQSSDFFPFDGNYAALRRDLRSRLQFQFWRRGVLASHYLRRDSGQSVLVIGSAGGQETKAALMYGAAHVDAVEMVPTMVALATGRYDPYIGGVFTNSRVSPHVGEGRSFLRASTRTYDIIQIFSNYTSSSLASGSGALSPDYLLTTDAFVEYYRHLTTNGVLHINHVAYPRIVTTAAAAWRAMGRGDFRSHVMVFEGERGDDWLPTVLVKMTPWTPAEVSDAVGFFSQQIDGDEPSALSENPLDAAGSFLPDVFYGGALPEHVIDALSFDATAVTDDRPFFRFMRRRIGPVSPSRATGLNAATASLLNVQLRGGWWPRDWEHLIVAGAASVFYSALFLAVAAFRSPRRSAHARPPWSALTYFSLLGVAFIAVELVFIQLSTKLIGYPLYAVTTVIATMLIGAACGSRASRRFLGTDSARWPLAFAGIAVAGATALVLEPRIAPYFMATPTAERAAIAGIILFPLAFFMGMPFPLGILAVERHSPAAVPWAWSVNGLWTTIGGTATAVASMCVGFRLTLIAALTAYAAASVMFVVLRRSLARPAAIAFQPETIVLRQPAHDGLLDA